MKFNMYGRFQIEVRRRDGEWIACRSGLGKTIVLDEVVIPAELVADEIAIYLDDIFHEFGGVGQCVEVVLE